jgi:hypothetical protein
MKGLSLIRNVAALAVVAGAAGVVGAVSGSGAGQQRQRRHRLPRPVRQHGLCEALSSTGSARH